MELAQKHKNQLERIKKDINASYQYFVRNNQRYKEFIKFVFDTALTQDDIDKLTELKKPVLEFNILESYISSLIGEFQENEPDFKVTAADGVPVQILNQQFFDTIEVVQDHIRAALSPAHNDGLKTKIMREMLAGGFSVVEVYTDYVNEKSFEQNIYIEKTFDSTLCGFDPLARESHKGDGRYCFKIVPKTKEEFAEEFGEERAKQYRFSKTVGDFNWSYMNKDEPIILVVDFFEKQRKKEKIIKLSTGHTILKKHYNKLVEKIRAEGKYGQPPIILDERTTHIETIVRYRLCENEVLAFDETNYAHLPLVFFDGNGILVYETESGASEQMTRPYVYHAKGTQRLKNFAGQTVANEIENMKMTQWKVALESIPPDYKEGYTYPQKLQSLVYYAYDPQNPDKALPPPAEAPRTPTPPIVSEVFMGTDAVTQAVLGSYDAVQGHIGAKDLSGKAIMMGAMQSNSASMPYAIGFINGMNRIAQIYIDLLPKYYTTPRSLPIRKPNGEREYAIINNPADSRSILLNYDPNHFNIEVELGVNSQMQKRLAMETIISLMNNSELFSEFMNTEGLEVLLENVDIRGVDELKVLAKEFMEAKRKALQAQQEREMNEMSDTDKIVNAQLQTEQMKVEQKVHESNQRLEIERMKAEQERMKTEAQLSVDIAKVSVEEQKAYTQLMQAYNQIAQDTDNQELEARKQDIEEQRLMNEMVKESIQQAENVLNERREVEE